MSVIQREIPPARISIILASDAHYAVVLRRGPSNCVASIGWDLRKNTLTLGQWLKGKIYSCDLSPDGKHMIYFTRGRGGRCWVAVSKVPYFKALDFYESNTCYDADVFFVQNSTYHIGSFLQSTIDQYKLKSFKTSKLQVSTDPSDQYYIQWEPHITEDYKLKNGQKYTSVLVYKLVLSKEWLILRFYSDLKFKYELLNQITNEKIGLLNWYSVVRYQNQVIFSEDGCLKTLKINEITDRESLDKATILHDLNAMKFEELIAPY